MSDVQTVPLCGRCSAPMVERVAPTTGRRSWRCSAWPTCRQTAKLPAYIEREQTVEADVPWWVTP